MNAKSRKTTLKVAAVAAGLVAVLLPPPVETPSQGAPVPGSHDTVVAPPTVD